MSARPLRSLRALRAFTLIELLTVIAIIGILAAIIIPTVSAVRDRAKVAKSASNLRQLATGCLLFANDNRGLLPEPGLNNGTQHWPEQVRSYVITHAGSAGDDLAIYGPNAVFQSPLRTEEFPNLESEHWRNGYSYGLSSFVNATLWARRVSAAPSPSTVIVLADKVPFLGGDLDYLGSSDGRFTPPWSKDSVSTADWVKPSPRLPGGQSSHVAFLDGHVAALSTAELEFQPATGSSRWIWW